MFNQSRKEDTEWKMIDQWLATIMEEGSDSLNDWESKFISDIQDRVMARNLLTSAQKDKLEQIYDKVIR